MGYDPILTWDPAGFGFPDWLPSREEVSRALSTAWHHTKGMAVATLSAEGTFSNDVGAFGVLPRPNPSNMGSLRGYAELRVMACDAAATALGVTEMGAGASADGSWLALATPSGGSSLILELPGTAQGTVVLAAGVAHTFVGGGNLVDDMRDFDFDLSYSTSNGNQGSVEKNVINEKKSEHIFRDSEGHLPSDTPENRAKLENVANDADARLGRDPHGKTWNARTNEYGTWTAVRNGKTENGGVNKTPREFDPETGLSRNLN